ncbi:hypothetical protein PTI98_011688 [Pleurotus ostreatus]|nr:hypothetical protein PTI98_011688 [Pleurotus ostreatus]
MSVTDDEGYRWTFTLTSRMPRLQDLAIAARVVDITLHMTLLFLALLLSATSWDIAVLGLLRTTQIRRLCFGEPMIVDYGHLAAECFRYSLGFGMSTTKRPRASTTAIIEVRPSEYTYLVNQSLGLAIGRSVV